MYNCIHIMIKRKIYIPILFILIIIIITPLTSKKENYTLITAKKIINESFTGYRAANQILIKNNKIIKIGVNISAPDGTTVISLPKKILIPGLIDAHTHILFYENNYNINFALELIRSEHEDSTIYRFLCATVRAHSYLSEGITTIRDLGNSGRFLDIKLKWLIDNDIIPGPNMYVSGPGIATIKAQFPITTPKEIVLKEYQIIDHDTDIKKTIDLYIDKNVNLIKVYAENSPGEGAISNNKFKKIVDYAHLKGLKVAAHAESDLDSYKAVQLGVDSLEHGFEITQKTMDLMKKNSVILVPTDFSRDMYRFIFDNVDIDKHQYSPLTIDNMLAKRAKRLNYAIEKGVTVAFGSDMYFNLFSKNTNIGKFSKDTILAYSEFGITNANLLKIATLNSAKLLDSSKQFGIIKEGASADIIGVTDDPLLDIKALNSVSFVMKNGQTYNGKCIHCSILKNYCAREKK